MRRITEPELKDILEAHAKWLRGEGGDRANLSRSDLIDANLSGADLRSANLRGAYLSGADLRSADLRSADLIDANLSGADLRSADLSRSDLIDANLRSANLRGAYLSGADLRSAYLRSAYLSGADLYNILTNKNCYQIAGVGNSSRLVSYFVKEDIVVCGCWECEQGNSLENFKKRVEDVYGKNGKTPNELLYGEYQDVIKFFEMRCNFEIY